MKVLILNQAFHPDVVSTAQHATDLALALSEVGHEVTVICGRRAYDDPSVVFAPRQTWKRIRIKRVLSTGLGKSSKWHRAIDFASLIVTSGISLLFTRKVDVIVTLTSPPLLSFIAALSVPLKAKYLVFWCMDLNPDEAIAAGWLRKNSLIARLLSRLLMHSLRKADRIIALDRFMKRRIEEKGVETAKIVIIPPWSHDEYVRFDSAGRTEFRERYGLHHKFVVMFSGNHSPCHPLETLLRAADKLASRDEIVFCLVGGGSEFRKVRDQLKMRNVRNTICIPYQPIEKLSASLSAADLHIVLMGDPFVGIVHPCKVYNVLAVATPFLYIGPAESHIQDILVEAPAVGFAHEHGDADQVAASIVEACARRRNATTATVKERFSQQRLVPELVYAIEEMTGKFSGKKGPQTDQQLPAQGSDSFREVG